MRGGLPARGGTPCRTGKASRRDKNRPGRGAAPAGCGPASNASRRKRAWRRRSPWRRTVPRTLRPILLTGSPGPWGNCCSMPWQRARFVPTSTLRICSVPLLACATRTIGRGGKPRYCAWSISSSMDYAGGRTRDTIDGPVTLFVTRSPDIGFPPTRPDSNLLATSPKGHNLPLPWCDLSPR